MSQTTQNAGVMPVGSQQEESMSTNSVASQPEIKTLKDVEKDHILKALDVFEGNKTKTANALGITIKTLYNKLHEYGLFDKYSVRNVSSNTKVGSDDSSAPGYF